jgi:hypothetical protein
MAGWFPRKSIAAKYWDLLLFSSGARTSKVIRLFRWLAKNWSLGPGDRIAPQDRFVTDDFRKALRIVLNEVQFGKAAYFELEPVLRERVRLLRSLFLCDLRTVFLLDGLVILLVWDDIFLQQEP